MNPSQSIEVFDRLHELLHRFRARMRKAMETVHPDLTLNEMRILMRAGRQPGLTQRDLVEHSHADKAQMARIVGVGEQHFKRVACATGNAKLDPLARAIIEAGTNALVKLRAN